MEGAAASDPGRWLEKQALAGLPDVFANGASRCASTLTPSSRFNFMREAQIWYSREHPDQRTPSSEFETIFVLSDEFYQELIVHRVPNDLEALKVLAASPAVLDLFMWTASGRFGLSVPLGSVRMARRYF